MKSNVSQYIYLDDVFVRTLIFECCDEEKRSSDTCSEIRKFATDLYGNKDWTIRKDVNGKPYFDSSRDYYFSISHTKGMLVIAMCKGSSVGVDVEAIRVVNSKIVKKYYTKQEKRKLMQKGINIPIESIRIWTLKEAYCKCIGKGLNKDTLMWDSLNQTEVVTESKCVYGYIVSVCKSKNIHIEKEKSENTIDD